MAEPEFSNDVRKALDAYVVPPLPTGFSDRLMARVEAGDAGATVPVTGFANRLRGQGGGESNAWRRSGRILGSVAFLSLATATAAAAGFFGNPVYVPVVSEVLDKAELVESPRQVASAKPVVLAAKPFTDAKPVKQLIPATGKDAVVDRITDLRKNPQFENLTPRQKLGLARKEVRTMVRSGEATPQEARLAVRELVRNADPETKAQWKETAQARRAARLERTTKTDATTALSASTEISPATTTTAEASTDTPVTDELPPIANSELSPEKIEALRERYRSATPEQRAQIRRTLRERRTTRTLRRAQ
jgi:hypothetical protein